ncbi:hypothetical protein [Loktanella sp. SALINAS62]|uniref:hypothetical protein n=1 Tax=Loktanella sp. SALINAS62 TaxID=2706124 RepID=UPI001B8BC1E4|nr:hypothetical protein [Loktanella sp. SALINAS62]MBS1303398.1 hypothetical protein [Loktanella sp. SALINAS62]
MFEGRFPKFLLFILPLAPTTALAQDSPVPGLAEGQVDGVPFSIPLDCARWDNDQRIIFSAGDDDGRRDDNGDGMRLTFSYFEPAAARTSGTLWIDDRELTLNSGFRPGPDAPKWDVTDTGAAFLGPTAGADSAEVSITIDCAPRAASERGFTGTVTGSIDGIVVGEALFCGAWDQPNAIQARTEEEQEPSVELFVMRENSQGTITVTAGTEEYQIVVAPIAGREFGMSADRVTFADELTSRGTGETYDVDLTFDCTDR